MEIRWNLNKLLFESLENHVEKSDSPVQMQEQPIKEWILKKRVSRQKYKIPLQYNHSRINL